MYKVCNWDITKNCNLTCLHCYNGMSSTKEKFLDITENQSQHIIDKLKAMSFTDLHLFGGEPLVSKNLFFILKYSKEKGIRTNITTNGLLMTEESSFQFMESKVENIVVSLDGLTSETCDYIRGKGTFELAISNIKKFLDIRTKLKSDISILISVAITKQNLPEIENLPEFVSKLGVDGAILTNLSRKGNADYNWNNIAFDESEKIEKLVLLYKNIEKYPNVKIIFNCKNLLTEYLRKKCNSNININYGLSCQAGINSFNLNYDGTFLPCSICEEEIFEKVIKKDIFKGNNKPNIMNMDVNILTNLSSFNKFIEFMHDDINYNRLITCQECKYDCKPCPVTDVDYRVEECEISINLLKHLDNLVLDSQIVISNQFSLKKEFNKFIILDCITQGVFDIDGIGIEILDFIQSNDGYKLKEVIEQIFQHYSSEVSYDTFTTDCLEFIYNLKHAKIVELVNN